MTGFLEKIFGSKKQKGEEVPSLVEDVLTALIDKSGLQLSFDIDIDEETKDLFVNLYGEDEEMLTAKEGLLLDSLQLFIRRVIQHQFPDEKGNINLDCSNFREQAEAALISLADKLKDIALAKNKTVYFRALPPKDRKVIHQYLAEDGRVKSRSIGEGHFKKIKIFPAKAGDNGGDDDREGLPQS